MSHPIEAITFDFFNTLVFHRQGQGRGRNLMDYLEAQGLNPLPWKHEILYEVFVTHDQAYSPAASLPERKRYYVELANRVFDRLHICASNTLVAKHADALWQILGPACFSLFPDALETLKVLQTRGLPLVVVSNWQSGLRHFCIELGLDIYFEYVLSSADLGFEKPNRQIFLEACNRIGVSPVNTLHVGDTYIDDFIGAKTAGLQAVLIDRFGTVGGNTTRVIQNLTELMNFVNDP